MAQHLDAKASLTTGEKRTRLAGLAAAARILAGMAIEQESASLAEPEIDADAYRQALLYLNAGVANLPRDCVDPLAILSALIRHLAGIGLDEEEIRYCKPYITNFTKDLIAQRKSSMHQAAARYWNAIAETQSLATDWAKQIFPLPQHEMDKALEREEARLTKQTNDPVLVAAYIKIMPLLWERSAISNYLAENPSLRAAMPRMSNLSEALRTANADFQLSPSQISGLAEMLKKEPKCELDTKKSCSVVRLEDLPILALVDGPGPFDSIEAWERFVTDLRSAPAWRGKYAEIRRAEDTISQMRRTPEEN